MEDEVKNMRMHFYGSQTISSMAILKIEVEQVESPILEEENENDFINKQLAGKMFDCLDGGDFEKRMLQEWAKKDRYTSVKLAGRGGKDEQYAKKIMEYLEKETLSKLLYICRFCSYFGGPGFPDLIVFGHEWGLRFTTEDLLPENVLFFILARELGIENIRILKIVPEKTQRQPSPVAIDTKEFFQKLLGHKRFSHYGNDLEELLQKEKERLRTVDEAQLQQVRDEIAYLETQKNRMPFHLVKKWAQRGLEKKDILDHMKFLDFSYRKEKSEMEQYMSDLSHDAKFKELGRGRDDASIQKRLEYIMKKCGVGVSRAGEILKVV